MNTSCYVKRGWMRQCWTALSRERGEEQTLEKTLAFWSNHRKETNTAGLKTHYTTLRSAPAPRGAAHQNPIPFGKDEEAESCDQIKQEILLPDAARSIPCNRRGAPGLA